MPKTSFAKIIFLIPIITLTLSGCTINFGTNKNAALADGGVYRTLNKGVNWLQKASVLTVGAKQTFASLDVSVFALDPQDNKAIYAGVVESGLFYSYDGGESWLGARSLGKVTITNIAVDPSNKCVIYATVANRVYKSTDCSRTWSVVYFDTDLKVAITALVIEAADSNNIYIGTSRGEIIKSQDRGDNWQTLNRFSGQVSRIIMNPANNKNIFVVTTGGLFRSVDSGLTWQNLEDKLKDLGRGIIIRDMIIGKEAQPTIFLATSYGLLKSTDGGNAWSKIELITPKTVTTINAITANPLDANEVYYVTNTTFYRSLDGGKNWNSAKLPTSRMGVKLLIDPKNPGVIYLATKQIKKQ